MEPNKAQWQPSGAPNPPKKTDKPCICRVRYSAVHPGSAGNAGGANWGNIP